jgi:nicotinamidase-related amidase
MALLVYDMQVGICSQVKTANQVVTRISGLLAVARSKGMRVAFTRHLSLPTTWMGSMQYRTAMAWQGKDEPDSVAPWFLRDAPGFQIVSELAPRPEDAVFDKITMSAFEGTPLTIALRTVADAPPPGKKSCSVAVLRSTCSQRAGRSAARSPCR